MDERANIEGKGGGGCPSGGVPGEKVTVSGGLSVCQGGACQGGAAEAEDTMTQLKYRSAFSFQTAFALLGFKLKKRLSTLRNVKLQCFRASMKH